MPGCDVTRCAAVIPSTRSEDEWFRLAPAMGDYIASGAGLRPGAAWPLGLAAVARRRAAAG
jgi:hypothetical protein